jgi:hypothetical protein
MRLGAVVWILSIGCGAGKADRALDSGLADPAIDAGADLEDGDDNLAEVAPLAWELSGQLTLDSDVIVEGESKLEIQLIGEDLTVLCDDTVEVETATAMDASQYPESTLLGWWRIFVGDPTPNGCFTDLYEFPVPVPMLIGIGPMHPEIVAAVGAVPSLGDVDALNGVYTSMDGGETVWVFGVIGTQDAYDGFAGPEESAPLSDGAWTIEPVYSFPL